MRGPIRRPIPEGFSRYPLLGAATLCEDAGGRLQALLAGAEGGAIRDRNGRGGVGRRGGRGVQVQRAPAAVSRRGGGHIAQHHGRVVAVQRHHRRVEPAEPADELRGHGGLAAENTGMGGAVGPEVADVLESPILLVELVDQLVLGRGPRLGLLVLADLRGEGGLVGETPTGDTGPRIEHGAGLGGGDVPHHLDRAVVSENEGNATEGHGNDGVLSASRGGEEAQKGCDDDHERPLVKKPIPKESAGGRTN